MTRLPSAASLASLFLRLALAAGFLSAVADRFGFWGPPGTSNVAWGNFDLFLAYTGQLLWFLPRSLVTLAGWAATTLEAVLALGLLAGVRLRETAAASGVLLASFAAAMTLGLGAEPALSSSVWTAAAGAFLLASLEPQDRHRCISHTDNHHEAGI